MLSLISKVKNWNTLGKIKAAFIALYSLASLRTRIFGSPTNDRDDEVSAFLFDFSFLVFISFLASIIITLVIKVFYATQGREMKRPTWNDNPLILTQPLKLFHFGAYLFIVTGLTMVVGTGIEFHFLNFMGITHILNGLGILIGIELLFKWKKTKIEP